MTDILLSRLVSKPSLYEGKDITTYGRVASVGKRSKFYFLSLRTGDSTKELKVILPKEHLDQPPTLFSTLQVQGEMTKSPDGQQYELKASKVLFYGKFAPEDVKIPHQQLGQVDDGVIRKMESQRLLTKRYQAIMFVSQRVKQYLHEVSTTAGLLHVQSPFITFSDCEGAGETFTLTSDIPGFFGKKGQEKKATLTVSGQVDEETITSRFLCPTYIFGPSFRSDPSKTRFHACEFFHYEPEIPFIDLAGLMTLEEQIITHLVHCISIDDELQECMTILGTDTKMLEDILDPTKDFVRVSYTEAIAILEAEQSQSGRFAVQPAWGIDLEKEHERFLCEEHFQYPTFVHGYPSAIKSFYMKLQEVEDPARQTCDGVDLLVPGIGELCGGSIREYRYDVLLESMKKKGLEPKDYQEYLSLRQQGTFPHGGFGMGFERFLMWVFGIEHIRDLSPFPRYFHC